MPFKWQLFRLLCFLQIACGMFYTLSSMVWFFNEGSFTAVVVLLAWIMIMSLATLGVNLVNRNYPAAPVEGKLKTVFNRLYLVNILAVALLFARVFSEWKQISFLAKATQISWHQLPFSFLYSLVLAIFALLTQFLILYGLYVLRLELYRNFQSKKFEFEETGV
jgi:hypothetical protein